ncbi:MAG: anti-sigma factor [Acidobacteriota bacterium]|nr:anti-sigma factor [Acidobacteriota bacterium]
MECEDVRGLVHGYLDGEMDLVKSLEVERHMRECEECGRELREQTALRLAINRDIPYFDAPPALRRRVRASLRHAHKAETSGARFNWRWLLAFASLVLAAVFVIALLLPLRSRQTGDDLLAQEVVAGHVRSLMAEHLTDVPSTDRHTVKPWLDRRLDFAPPVRDLSAEGFALVGGRLDYLDRRAVAALVYQRREHLINLYVWPSTPSENSAEIAKARQGYNLISWTDSGMNFWAVSDINADELREFVNAFRSAR